jgi:hypothetical protein
MHLKIPFLEHPRKILQFLIVKGPIETMQLILGIPGRVARRKVVLALDKIKKIATSGHFGRVLSTEEKY